MPADSAITRQRAELVTRTDLLDLARFSDEHGHAVSFYFALTSTPDNSHRAEAIAIKRLIQKAQTHFASQSMPASLAKDLEEILTVAEEVRLNPARLRAVFACREMRVWRDFDLPAPHSISRLVVGQGFVMLPLLAAVQSCAPYCVVILETGKARAFVVRGTEIQEIAGKLPTEDLSLHPEDSRVGWSKRIDKDVEEHEKTYFKKLFDVLYEFMTEQQIPRLVVGCREDLWGEIQPQFAILRSSAFLGHFHLPNFAIGSADILRVAIPVLQEAQKRRSIDLLSEINESPSRAAFGVRDVFRALGEGRVLKLALGKLPNQTISVCRDCGGMWAGAGHNCILCGSAKSYYIAAEEGLIRQAFLTDAEILWVEADTAPGFSGAAALLRY